MDNAGRLKLMREALEGAGLDDIRDDYSGRGMNSKTCLAFVVEGGQLLGSIADVVEAAVEFAVDADNPDWREVVGLFRGARTDSMGRDVVVYFPSLITEPDNG